MGGVCLDSTVANHGAVVLDCRWYDMMWCGGTVILCS